MSKPCCKPQWISVPDYRGANKYGFTSRKISVKVPCGHCVNCLFNAQRDWMLRMSLEQEISETAYFVTLTMNDDNIGDNVVDVKDVQRFIANIRQKIKRASKDYDFDLELRYFAVGEYGKNTNRAHYHVMLFNLPFHDIRFVLNFLQECWKKGFIHVQFACMKNIGYIAKYMTKFDPRPHVVDPFALCRCGLLLASLISRKNLK